MVSRSGREALLLSEVGHIDGGLDHYVDGYEWAVPQDVELDDDRLSWRVDTAPPRTARPGPGLLESFLTLDRAPHASILAYARRWGPLWLCEHSVSYEHDLVRCQPRRLPDIDGFWEPLSDWHQWAGWMRATLRVARALHANRPANQADWDVVAHPADRLLAQLLRKAGWHWVRSEADGEENEYPPHVDPWTVSPQSQQRALSFVLDSLLEVSGVRPALQWARGKPTLQLRGYGLFGALVAQLLFDACRTDGFAVCTSCGTPYLPPTRRPRWDRNSYCPDCGRKAAMRDASARYRRTEKYHEARRNRLAASQPH